MKYPVCISAYLLPDTKPAEEAIFLLLILLDLKVEKYIWHYVNKDQLTFQKF